jgi:hypothetical protein
MKLPDWDIKKQSWDAYYAFHIGVDKTSTCKRYYYNSPLFVMFDSGELICTNGRPNPYQRGEYPSLNLSVWASGDVGLPTLYAPDGEQIRSAWLKDNGWRYLLVDHDSKRVVQLGYGDLKARVPKRFEGRASAYFRGDGTLPIGAPVSVAKPHRMTLTKDEREHISGLKAGITAAVQLDPNHPVNVHPEANYWGYSWNTPGPPMAERLLQVEKLTDLDVKEQWALLKFRVRRKVQLYPYLLTERP